MFYYNIYKKILFKWRYILNFFKCKKIGKGSIFRGRGIIIKGKNITIGSKVSVNNYVIINSKQANIIIGDRVTISDKVYITSTGLNLINLKNKKEHIEKDIYIGNNVWLGAGSTILPGVTIGEDTVVGAGAVVTKNVPANVVVVGIPAKAVQKL